jgi:hypothetical protein
MSNISSIYENSFHCHKNTQINKLLPSSGETTTPKAKLTKNATTGECERFHLFG